MSILSIRKGHGQMLTSDCRLQLSNQSICHHIHRTVRNQHLSRRRGAQISILLPIPGDDITIGPLTGITSWSWMNTTICTSTGRRVLCSFTKRMWIKRETSYSLSQKRRNSDAKKTKEEPLKFGTSISHLELAGLGVWWKLLYRREMNNQHGATMPT